MSRSNTFFNTKATSHVRRNKYVEFMDDTAFLKLHWSKQLELRPLRNKKRWENDANIDYDNRLDNWDDPEGEQ